MLEIKAIAMEFPAEANIVGQALFIKTVEDLYEAGSATVVISPLHSLK